MTRVAVITAIYDGFDTLKPALPQDGLEALGAIELGSIDTTKVGDVTMAQWLAAMRDGAAGWVDRLE